MKSQKISDASIALQECLEESLFNNCLDFKTDEHGNECNMIQRLKKICPQARQPKDSSRTKHKK